ncbi:TAXI family TRAP transporter solute-binding subunit [Tropicimonas sp.]|uniref:TAXI family TRAP transporter solute-binding subunit n=1 Tax=Tropicimonas sp. TaxID=2067044 RepID=UPI003A8A8671
MRFGTIFISILLLAAAVIYLLRDLPPPRDLRFAAGRQGGGYWNIASQYRDILARDGIEVEIVETAGSVENVRLLAGGLAEVGLVQGGIAAPGGVKALGVVFVEPVLAFVRHDGAVPVNVADWQGVRVAAGSPGSGTRAAAEQLFAAAAVAPGANPLVGLDGAEAAQAVADGAVDVALFVAPVESEYLRPLIDAQEFDLLQLDNIDGLSLRLPFSRVVTVPSGAVRLSSPPVPPEPVRLLSLRARLAAVDHLHPALADRLVVAARQIHGGRGILSVEGQFPSVVGVDMPIDQSTTRLVLEGQGAFHGWLPYWIAAQIRRVLLVMVPVLFLLVPLIRSLPVAYRWSMRRRVWRHYNAIGGIGLQVPDAAGQAELRDLDNRLVAIDTELATMKLPPPFRESAYNARLHVDLVRRHIAGRLAAPGGQENGETAPKRHGDVA